MKDLSNFLQNQIWHQAMYKSKLKPDYHKKNAWCSWDSSLGVLQAPSDKVSLVKYMLLVGKAT